MKRSIWMSAAVLVCLAAPSSAVHEDDGKVLDRIPPYRGAGFRSGRPPVSRGQDVLLSFTNSGVQLMSWLPLMEFSPNASSGNSCWNYTSPSGREYALMGVSNGIGFVEITDPGDPTIVGFVPTNGSLWHDVRTYQNYAYAVGESGPGIQVIDLSQIDSGVVQQVAVVTTGGSTATHTVTVNTQSGYLYRAGGNGNGLRIYSLANPALPTYVTAWSTKYVHEATVISYTSGTYAGKEIAFLCGGYNNGWSSTGLTILDVTNKSNILQLASISYTGAAYCHQGWPSDDRKYFYINDEKDEGNGALTRTIVINIQSLSNPFYAGSFTNSSTAIGHNLYVKGNSIYEANYRSGMRVFDKTNQTNPTEVAWFDTWPGDDVASFNSLWNVNPYFTNNIVIGSDIEKGLFVWHVGQAQLVWSLPNGLPTSIDPLGGTVSLLLTPQSGQSVLPGSEELHYDTGNGWQTVGLSSLGAGQYEALFPPIACGDSVDWYVSAKSAVTGFTWNDPEGAAAGAYNTLSGTTVNTVLVDACETVGGWVSGDVNDTATDGMWVLVNPVGTGVAPEDDHTVLGSQAWCTGIGPGWEAPSGSDVDGGLTTLITPAMDLTGLAQPVLSYWLWYNVSFGAFPFEDAFLVELSNDNGASWVQVEQVGPSGYGVDGGWTHHTLNVNDFLPPTSTMRLRFLASDTVNDSTVEAAIDDLSIFDVACPGAPQIYCTGKQNSQGCTPAMAASGVASMSSSQPLMLSASDMLNNKFGLLFYGTAQASLPFQGGTLCVALPITRTSIQQSGGSSSGSDCTGTYTFDFNAYLQSGQDPNLGVGSTVACQWWARDPNDPTGFATSLSNAASFVVAP